MNNAIFCTAGHSGALEYAQKALADRGIHFIHRKDPDVTHLLLPVPSFEADGRIKGGGILENILADLPEDLTVIGGNLCHPILQGYKTIDLLQDPLYLAQNAAITADCAIRVAGAHLPTVFRDCPVLVIGWGRIGKCLSTILKKMDCHVTVAVRKESDRCMLAALGFQSILIPQIPEFLQEFRLIFNTVPATVLEEAQLRGCRPDRILVELASKPGLWGESVISALGLPGKYAPEASGALIAERILDIL
jgi:dipicolinate synthase subunit A